MIINAIFDQLDNQLPVGFKSVVNAVIQFFQNAFSDPITINIHVGYGEIGGQLLSSGALGQSEHATISSSYATIRDALIADAISSDDLSSVNSLTFSDPSPGTQYFVPRAEAKALGLLSANSPGIDGSVGFSSTAPIDYDNSDGVSPGTYDFYGIVAHEITEVMGRAFGDGVNYPFDLYHYASPGVRTFFGTQTGYFSVDDGNTDLANFNTNPSGDFADWANSVPGDSFRAFAQSGGVLAVTSWDMIVMDAIGYDRFVSPPPPPPPHLAQTSDFDGDLRSDFLWQNDNGQAAIWLINGLSVSSSGYVAGVPSAGWKVIGSGDFNGDGKSDIVWQNTSTRQAVVWLMNGLSVTTGSVVGGTPNAGWQVIGSGDFDGDTKSDILWQNTTTRQAAVWLMNGVGVTGGGVVGGAPNPGWVVKGSGDFNGDGKSDILWQNTTTRQAAVWLMNGLGVAGGSVIGSAPNAGWVVKGSGDFNGDGKSDILWQNTNTRQAAVWLMNGLTVTGGGVVGGTPNAGWNVVGAADTDGDGKSDILWQNTNGQALVWLMNGLSVTGASNVGSNPGPAWHLIGPGG
jgi:hypothetical protein